MPSTRYTWDQSLRRFRDTETGRLISPANVIELRETFLAKQLDRADEATRAATRLLAAGELTVGAWERRMRAVITSVHTVAYALGRGGMNAMGALDKTAVGGLIRDQWAYLNHFAREVADGTLSAEAITSRGHLYVDAAANSHARGQVASYGYLDLPVMPGDGATACLVRCKCRWDIKDEEDAWVATWVLGSSKTGPCADCRDRSSKYGNYRVSKTTA